jgi:hypothetical protein
MLQDEGTHGRRGTKCASDQRKQLPSTGGAHPAADAPSGTNEVQEELMSEVGLVSDGAQHVVDHCGCAVRWGYGGRCSDKDPHSLGKMQRFVCQLAGHC